MIRRSSVPVPLALCVFSAMAIACKSPPATESDDPDPATPMESEADTDTDSDTDADTDTDTDTDGPDTLALHGYPSFPLVYVGESVQLRARASTSDGQTAVGNDSSWSSTSGPGSVTPTGLYTASASGEADVRVMYDGLERAFAVRVRDPADSITSLDLHPSSATAVAGTSLFFSATVETISGARGDRADSCEWSSSDNAVAVASFGGLVLPQAEGTAEITANCDGQTASSTVTVGPNTPGAVTIAASGFELETADTYRLNATIENTGGASAARLDLNQPESGAVRRFSLPTLGTGDSLPISIRQSYTGPRPIVLPVEISLDNGTTQTVPVDLPGDAEADVSVEFGGITVFGPTDAGVIFTITNHGPETLEDVTVYFERDQPGATSLSDFEPADAERSETIATLPPNEPYTWLFDYDQVPFQETWDSCGFVPIGTWSDPTPNDNFACGTFPEY